MPSFIGPAERSLFVIEFLPSESVDRPRTVIVAPPFAEEMNRCRRMIYEQAQALAANGFRVIVADLYGTGDSRGEFCDASWETWCENLSEVARAVSERGEPYGILAVRLGALLALDSRANLTSGADRTVLWNPCLSGQAYLRQFLRLRQASQLAAGVSERETLGEMLNRFNSGRTLEIAGYEVSPELALPIQALRLETLEIPPSLPIAWYDVVSNPESELPESTVRTVRQWRESGINVRAEPVHGYQFWATVEITVAPGLIAKTTSAFDGM